MQCKVEVLSSVLQNSRHLLKVVESTSRLVPVYCIIRDFKEDINEIKVFCIAKIGGPVRYRNISSA